MTRQPRNIVASVQARLVQRSHELHVEHQLTLARFAGERLLYRLSVSPRTIADAAEIGADPSIVIEATVRAVSTGLVSPKELRAATKRRSARVRQLVARALQEVDLRA